MRRPPGGRRPRPSAVQKFGGLVWASMAYILKSLNPPLAGEIVERSSKAESLRAGLGEAVYGLAPLCALVWRLNSVPPHVRCAQMPRLPRSGRGRWRRQRLGSSVSSRWGRAPAGGRRLGSQGPAGGLNSQAGGRQSGRGSLLISNFIWLAHNWISPLVGCCSH